MAPLLSFAYTFFLLIFLDLSIELPTGENPSSSFEFIKRLQGSRKGDKVKGLNNLKNYLKTFGYIDYHFPNNNTHVEDDEEFDDLLESTIKTYQNHYHLNSTGVLDAETVKLMMRPRCGVSDMMMRGGRKTHRRSFYGESHYTFFDGEPKWPDFMGHLTYGFSANTPANLMNPIKLALGTWSSQSHFQFSKADTFEYADLKFDFGVIDGLNNFLAYAHAPPDGNALFDSAEMWAAGSPPDKMNLFSVALHEIGHLLGLNHTNIEAAIMYPYFNYGEAKGLHDDDIYGIRALYPYIGARRGRDPPI